MGKILFREEQSFRQSWIIYPVYVMSLSFIGLMSYGMVRQVFYDRDWGSSPMSDQGLITTFILVSILMVGIIILFQMSTLKTTITEEGIYYVYPPFINKKQLIPAEDVLKYEVRRYSPVLEYGGWGIRVGWKNGKAYTVKGNIVIRLDLKGNKKLLCGTQKKEQVGWAMKKMLAKEK